MAEKSVSKTTANSRTKTVKEKKEPASRAKNLVIVESPAKAKTLKKFLGANYKVEASMGHVRDLPKSEMGVDTENDFEPKYITIRGKGELLSKLRKEVKSADKVYLATDPDREGEAISWHLTYALKLEDKPFYRITFNEITKNAVKKSIKEARALDIQLIDAQQARRVLDRIVGYKLSPVLWHKAKKGLSGGRVQSVTLKIICDREEEISSFIPEEFWTIETKLVTDTKKAFTAKFYGISDNKLELKSEAEAKEITEALQHSEHVIDEIKTGKRIRKPSPPFTTSTLQQETSKVFGFSAVKTMQIAQQLYEGVDIAEEGTVGLISYIRTDSVRISDEAYEEAKGFIEMSYGSEYLPEIKNEYKSKGRAQDAHEAVRPSTVVFTPDKVRDSLTKDQFKLYTLIWERFVASQMSPSVSDTVSVKISAGQYSLRASGSKQSFDGYKRVYKKEDEETDKSESEMPALSESDRLTVKSIDPEQHFTQPPPRFSEALIVRTLEENGVGRPSTYAPTISTLVQRRYVIKENKVFYPTELGNIVNDMLADNFEDIVNIEFTAKMEKELDSVEDGEIYWKDIIRNFYPSFDAKIKAAEQSIEKIELKDEETDIPCPGCGRNMVIKFGRFGKFLACPGFPDCRNTLPYNEEAGVDCPMCRGKLLVKKTKKGRIYYGCENHPNCEFASWNKPTGEKCPQCGGYLVLKGSKQKNVHCSNAQCGFSKPIEEGNENSDET